MHYGPSWQAYDLPQEWDGGPEIFPPQLFTGHGPSSPGAPRVPPAPPANISVTWRMSSASTAPGQLSATPGRPPINLPTKPVQHAAELCRSDVAGITDILSLRVISYDEYDAFDKFDDRLDFGSAKGKAPTRLKQFANRMWQPTFNMLNTWKKVWQSGFLEKKHRSIIQGQNRLKHLWDRPPQREMEVEDIWDTFKTRLPWEYFDNVEWIRQQWVEMILK